MADDKRRLSTDRWRALVAAADAGDPAIKDHNQPTTTDVDGYRYFDVTEPVESHGFIFLRGAYRAA